jgi:hypothetical protein
MASSDSASFINKIKESAKQPFNELYAAAKDVRNKKAIRDGEIPDPDAEPINAPKYDPSFNANLKSVVNSPTNEAVNDFSEYRLPQFRGDSPVVQDSPSQFLRGDAPKLPPAPKEPTTPEEHFQDGWQAAAEQHLLANIAKDMAVKNAKRALPADMSALPTAPSDEERSSLLDKTGTSFNKNSIMDWTNLQRVRDGLEPFSLKEFKAFAAKDTAKTANQTPKVSAEDEQQAPPSDPSLKVQRVVGPDGLDHGWVATPKDFIPTPDADVADQPQPANVISYPKQGDEGFQTPAQRIAAMTQQSDAKRLGAQEDFMQRVRAERELQNAIDNNKLSVGGKTGEDWLRELQNQQSLAKIASVIKANGDKANGWESKVDEDTAAGVSKLLAANKDNPNIDPATVVQSYTENFKPRTKADFEGYTKVVNTLGNQNNVEATSRNLAGENSKVLNSLSDEAQRQAQIDRAEGLNESQISSRAKVVDENTKQRIKMLSDGIPQDVVGGLGTGLNFDREKAAKISADFKASQDTALRVLTPKGLSVFKKAKSEGKDDNSAFSAGLQVDKSDSATNEFISAGGDPRAISNAKDSDGNLDLQKLAILKSQLSSNQKLESSKFGTSARTEFDRVFGETGDAIKAHGAATRFQENEDIRDSLVGEGTSNKEIEKITGADGIINKGKAKEILSRKEDVKLQTKQYQTYVSESTSLATRKSDLLKKMAELKPGLETPESKAAITAIEDEIAQLSEREKTINLLKDSALRVIKNKGKSDSEDESTKPAPVVATPAQIQAKKAILSALDKR